MFISWSQELLPNNFIPFVPSFVTTFQIVDFILYIKSWGSLVHHLFNCKIRRLIHIISFLPFPSKWHTPCWMSMLDLKWNCLNLVLHIGLMLMGFLCCSFSWKLKLIYYWVGILYFFIDPKFKVSDVALKAFCINAINKNESIFKTIMC
jgi:hypothetical protein